MESKASDRSFGFHEGSLEGSNIQPRFSSERGINDTAVCLIGLQNEYAKKGGKLFKKVEKWMEASNMIANIQTVIDLSRQKGVTIIHSPYKQMGSQLFGEGTWNSRFIDEATPMEGDSILSENEGSLFEETNLEEILADHAIRRIFFLGLETQTCADAAKQVQQLLPFVESYVVSDGCASQSETEHNEVLSLAFGGVVSTSDVERMMMRSSVSTTNREPIRNKHRHRSVFLSGAAVDMIVGEEEGGGDERKIVDDIFEIADVSGDGKLELEEIKMLLRKVSGDGETVEELLLQQKMFAKDALLSKDDLYDLLFERQTNKSWSDRLSLFLILWILPLLYSFSTRLPFICVALEVKERIQAQALAQAQADDISYLSQVGYVLAAYQTCRSIANSIISILGGKRPFKRLELPMLTMGLLGFVYSYVFSSNNNNTSWVHLFALCGVGLSETVVNLQSALVRETKMESPSRIPDKEILSQRMRLQYSSVSAGSFLAYVGGGQMYTRYGFRAVALMGIVSQSVQILLAGIYLKLSSQTTHEDVDGGKAIRAVMYQLRAQRILAEESLLLASNPEAFLASEQPGFSDAIEKANENKNLKLSLTRMYRNVFSSYGGRMQSFAGRMQQWIAGANLHSSTTSTYGASYNSSSRSNSGPPSSVSSSVRGVGANAITQNMLTLMQTGVGGDTLTENDFVSYLAPRVYLYFYGHARQSCVTIIWPYLKVVVLTQATMALCIGTFLSTALLFYTNEYGMEASEVGIYLGIGEGLGAAVIFGGRYVTLLAAYLCQTKTKTTSKKPGWFRAIVSRPLHVPAILLLLATSTMCFSIPNKYVSIAFQLVMSCVNDLSVSLLNELLSTSLPIDQFKKSQGIGQVLRRLGNMTTGLLGPILFGVGSNVPFLVFGGIVNLWSLILFMFLRTHAGTVMNYHQQQREQQQSPPMMGLLEPFYGTATTPWHVYEENYFKGNKRAIERQHNPTGRTTLDNAILEHRMRRIQAALQIEQRKRHALQEKLIKDKILKYDYR